MARIAYPPLDDLPEGLAQVIASRVAPGRGKVWHMLCWAPPAAETFIEYSEAIRHRNSVPPALQELMILRVGHVCNAPYEVHHHERIARKVGLREGAVAAAAVGPASPDLDSKERQALALVDELIATKGLSAASFDAAVREHGVQRVTEMVLMVGFYTMASMFLNSFGVDIETTELPA